MRSRRERREPPSKPGLQAMKARNRSLLVASFRSMKKAALIWGELMAHGKATGRRRSALGTIVAAIAQSNSCIVVTDNERDFQRIDIINPHRATVI